MAEAKSLGMKLTLQETVARELIRAEGFDPDDGDGLDAWMDHAERVLHALGLDDLDAAAERLARYLYSQGHGYDIDADPAARDSMLAVARGALEAACTATEGEDG